MILLRMMEAMITIIDDRPIVIRFRNYKHFNDVFKWGTLARETLIKNIKKEVFGVKETFKHFEQLVAWYDDEGMAIFSNIDYVNGLHTKKLFLDFDCTAN